MFSKIYKIDIRTSKRVEFLSITSRIQEKISEAKVKEGFINLYVPHTTAGILINEDYDPSVKEDIIDKLEEIAPRTGKYKHLEGNADSHIKSAIVGNSLTIPIHEGRLILGSWQGVFFAEFDGPRTRELYLQIVGSGG